MRTRGKTDCAQPDIVEALRGIPGMSVTDTHGVGGGFPDIICGWEASNYLFEIKTPGCAKRLTKDEKKWFEGWRGQAAVVETADDCLRIMGIRREQP